VPAGVDEVVRTVSVDVLPVVAAGLNVPVAPAGRPLTLNVTEPAKPPVRVRVTEYVVLDPLVTVRLAGVRAIEKSPVTGAVTTSVTDVVRVSVPLVPVTVSG
jgi:hypothetical protein